MIQRNSSRLRQINLSFSYLESYPLQTSYFVQWTKYITISTPLIGSLSKLQLVGKSGSRIQFRQDTLLTLSLPIFWQFCSPSATFISTASGIMESQACKFSKILFFVPFLLITFNKYPKFEVSKPRIRWILHYVCKQRDLKGRGGSALAVCYDVADRRRWQWKS